MRRLAPAVAAGVLALAAPAAAVARPGTAVNLDRAGYRVRVRIEPNRATRPSRVVVTLGRSGRRIRRARVTLALTMLGMPMPPQRYALAETTPGLYTCTLAAPGMVGRFGVTLTVRPPDARTVTVHFVDLVVST